MLSASENLSTTRSTSCRANDSRLAHHALTGDTNSPVRIELVLSGGGLRGASHAGVLQRLAEHDIPIEAKEKREKCHGSFFSKLLD